MKNVWIVVSLSILRQGYGRYAELGSKFFSKPHSAVFSSARRACAVLRNVQFSCIPQASASFYKKYMHRLQL